jgi:hypothetical protein
MQKSKTITHAATSALLALFRLGGTPPTEKRKRKRLLL